MNLNGPHWSTSRESSAKIITVDKIANLQILLETISWCSFWKVKHKEIIFELLLGGGRTQPLGIKDVSWVLVARNWLSAYICVISYPRVVQQHVEFDQPKKHGHAWMWHLYPAKEPNSLPALRLQACILLAHFHVSVHPFLSTWKCPIPFAACFFPTGLPWIQSYLPVVRFHAFSEMSFGISDDLWGPKAQGCICQVFWRHRNYSVGCFWSNLTH